MPTIAAPPSSATPVRTGRLWLAVATGLLLLSAEAAAAPPDTVLRPAEQIDARRLGRVSDDERAVLRVEWRTAQTGADEARAVQGMLDSLREMDATVAEIRRLVAARPAPAPVPAPAAAPAEAASGGLVLAIGALAAAALAALFWLYRRKQAGATATAQATPARSEPGGPPPEATMPVAAPAPKAEPSKPAAAPPPRAVPPQRLSAVAAAVAAPPAAPASPPPMSPLAAPEPATSAATPPAAEPVQRVDFSLEDEEPEIVARANARVPVPRKPNASPHVPERRQEISIEPTLQLAEIMLSMGLAQGAAQALVEYTEANPRQAVYHWLKLLAIYRDTGQRKDFEETAEKLRKFFNIQAAGTASAGEGGAQTLEGFPRIAEQVAKLWPTPDECAVYLRHLLEDNRDGSRIGFPQGVAEEILLLTEVLKINAGGRQAAPGLRSTV